MGNRSTSVRLITANVKDDERCRILRFGNYAEETTTTTGTGDLTLAGAAGAAYQTIGDVLNDGETSIFSVSNGDDREVFVGTYTASGGTISRDVILESTNSDAAVDWPAGTKYIWIDRGADLISPQRSVTGAVTLDIFDRVVFADASGGNFAITLPDAADCPGKDFLILDTGSSGTITLTPDAGDTINGSSSKTLTTQYTAIHLRSDGANWYYAASGGGATNLDDLGDVDTSGVSTDDVLAYDRASWVATTLNYSTVEALDDLSDVNTSGVSTDDVLAYDGASWVATTLSYSTVDALDDLSDVDLTGGLPPTNNYALTYQAGSGTWQPAPVITANGATQFTRELGRRGISNPGAKIYADATTGTKPIKVDSTTLCDNLNADLLDGYHASHFSTVAALNDLSDVDTSGVATDDVLAYNGEAGFRPRSAIPPSTPSTTSATSTPLRPVTAKC